MCTIAEYYLSAEQPPVKFPSKRVGNGLRNFLCDHLFDKELLISYAPKSEFGASRAFSWLTGGRLCKYNETGNTIEPHQSINFKLVRQLFELGYIKVNRDIKRPHARCVIFEWIDDIKLYRRHILKRAIFGETATATSIIVSSIAAHYGLIVKYSSAKGLFEVCQGEQAMPVPNLVAERTYIFMNAKGEPVTSWRDMLLIEWETALYQIAKESKAIKRPLQVPEGDITHFSKHKTS